MADAADLLDRRTGIITDLVPRPMPNRAPEPLRLWQARISDTREFSPWPSDLVSSGCAWWDDDVARLAAIGEAVERYCGALIPGDLESVSANQLTASGRQVLDTSALALFSTEQYQTPGFPFVPFTADLPLRWVSGQNMLTGENCAVPIGLVYTTVHRAGTFTIPCSISYNDEPCTNPLPYAGLAAGTDREQAEINALLELIERDAVTTSWLSGTMWPEIIVSHPLSQILQDRCDALAVRLFHVPAAVLIPVVAAVVEDPITGLLSLGSAARTDPAQAALKATAEACQLHLMLAELDDPNSAVMRLAVTESNCPLRRWRRDRRYRYSYDCHGWRDVRDLACQLQLYLDPNMRAAFRDRLAHATTTCLRNLATKQQSTRIELVDALTSIGIPLVSVDITTPDIRTAGWTAVRVIAPGLRPNTPAAFPPLGEDRRDSQQTLDVSLPLPYA